MTMDTLQEFFATIPNETHRARFQEVMQWTGRTFPDLEITIKWNQPMFIHNGTFIVAYGAASKYLTVAPEIQVLQEFLDQITDHGYGHTKMKFQIRWNQEVNYELLHDIIERCIEFKKGSKTFWAG